VLPSKTRTQQPVSKIWQLLSFSFLTFSAILQMQDTDCPHRSFQNLIFFWLEVPSTTPLSNSEIEIFPLIFQDFSTLWSEFHDELCHGRCSSPLTFLMQEAYGALPTIITPLNVSTSKDDGKANWPVWSSLSIREIPWELWGLYNNSLILEYFPI